MPGDERHSLAAWLNELGYDDWDRKMVNDFQAGGRGMALVEAIKRQAGQGKAAPFEEGLEQAQEKLTAPVNLIPTTPGTDIQDSRIVGCRVQTRRLTASETCAGLLRCPAPR